MKIINAVIFDYAFTISSSLYFKTSHPDILNWNDLIRNLIVKNIAVFDNWMLGKISLSDITIMIMKETGEDYTSIYKCLQEGCKNQIENQAVINFAKNLKKQNIPIGLVTVNSDVFNSVVIPEYQYDKLFDIILNSCDFGTTDKRVLWPIAFRKLGDEINYHNSLLIEDGIKNPQQFRDAGGYAIEYQDDSNLIIEIEKYVFTSNMSLVNY